MWHWHSNRHTGHRSRTRSPETNPQPYDELSLTTDARIHNGKKRVSSASGVGKPSKSMKLEHSLRKKILKMASEYYSVIKKGNNAVCNNMHVPRKCHTK